MMVMLILFALETWVDTIFVKVPPGDSVIIGETVYPSEFQKVPEWFRRDFVNQMEKLGKGQVVIDGCVQVGIKRDVLYYLKGDTLFSETGKGKKMIGTGIHSFNLWGNDLVYSLEDGSVLRNEKKIGIFKPPVLIGGGDVPVLMDGDGMVYAESGFLIKSFKPCGKESIPYVVSGKKIYIKRDHFFMRWEGLPVVSRGGKYKRALFWCDGHGRVWYKEWNNGWSIQEPVIPDSLLPEAEMGQALFFIDDTTILVSSPDGTLQFFRKRNKEWTELKRIDKGFSFATFVQHSGLLFAGLKDGRVLLVDRELKSVKMVDSVPSFASPAFFNGKLVIGGGDGYIKGLKTSRIPPPVRIASGKINGDNRDDLVAIGSDGKVRIFFSPDFREDSTSLPEVMEFATPSIADVDGDGQNEIVVSTLYGDVYVFKRKGGRFISVDTWKFIPMMGIGDLKAYFNKYLPPGRMFTRDDRVVDAIKKLLDNIDEKYIDEVAFCIAHMPSEVVRTMVHKGDIDVLINNARDIYEVAKSLPYVEIVEKDGYTTLLYEDKYELAREIYYYYVVLPRILYEIPCRVNISYWKHPPEFYGVDSLKWLQKRIDIYEDEGEFWRDVFIHDSLFGRTVVDAVRDARTIKEAVQKLQRFQSVAYKGNRMRFGYRTQDIQPLQIYYKSYGSCGEQSILQCAFARTVLIPNYVVVDRGEDHQWNHFWMPYDYKKDEIHCGEWHHQDVNGKIESHLANPWVSSEGMKKDVSAVVGWRGDDYQFPVTQCGYTETGEVNIKVIDKQGKPVDGALVVLRSHWNRRNTPTIWGYTDSEGKVIFQAGYEPYGYTIDVLSRSGLGGKKLFWLKEGDTVSIDIEIDAEGLGKVDIVKGMDSVAVSDAKTVFRGFNFITGTPYRISSKTLKKLGYAGSGIEELPAGKAVYTLKRRDDHYWIVNPMKNLYLKAMVLITHERENQTPEIYVEPEKLEIISGDSAVINIHVSDNGKLKGVCAVIDGRRVWSAKSSGRFVFYSGKGGPMLPGRYRIKFTAVDMAGNESIKYVELVIKPSSVFRDQIIHQDPSPDSVPRGSWVYGPVKVKSLPFLMVMIDSPDEVDLDLYVYRDKNGDGRVVSKEKIASSTGPTDKEVVFVKNPDDGEYWIYVNGCTVPEKTARFNLYTSFILNEKGEAE
ncbi:hypothetical protein DRQ23_01960 [bacterium]|nr:MAG: hypothetical protein DRQ23_01960 [bacterium]